MTQSSSKIPTVEIIYTTPLINPVKYVPDLEIINSDFKANSFVFEKAMSGGVTIKNADDSLEGSRYRDIFLLYFISSNAYYLIPRYQNLDMTGQIIFQGYADDKSERINIASEIDMRGQFYELIILPKNQVESLKYLPSFQKGEELYLQNEQK